MIEKNFLLLKWFLVCFLLAVTASAITDAEDSYLSERFTYYATQLKNTSAHNHYSPNQYTTCSYYDVCHFDINTVGWSVRTMCCLQKYMHFQSFPTLKMMLVLFLLENICCVHVCGIILQNNSEYFPAPLDVNYSYVGHKFANGAVISNEINEICFATNTQNKWQDMLQTDIYGALSWQYLGSANEGTFSYYPLANWSSPNQCPGDYDPRKRAWYVSHIMKTNTMVLTVGQV